jgi:hypothetical protein
MTHRRRNRLWLLTIYTLVSQKHTHTRLVKELGGGSDHIGNPPLPIICVTTDEVATVQSQPKRQWTHQAVEVALGRLDEREALEHGRAEEGQGRPHRRQVVL